MDCGCAANTYKCRSEHIALCWGHGLVCPVERAGIRAGDTVFIPSTAGVALFGLQIAEAKGAEVIISGRPENEQRARLLGADHYIDHNRTWLFLVKGMISAWIK
jgi:D-arabinose 1-dehydrogenase-like Zn-dependent alcohol dehydrogenase